MKKVIMISLSSLLVTANTWSDEYYEPENSQPDAYREVGYQPQTYPLADDDEEKTYEGVSYRIESEKFQETDSDIEGYEDQETDDEDEVDNEDSQKIHSDYDIEGYESQDTQNEIDNEASQKIASETEVDENESYLEGISVLGKEKIAYLSIKGSKIPIKEGEKFTFSRDSGLGTWRVIRIKTESVVLKAQGRDLEEELHLHSRLPLSERKKPHLKETTDASLNQNTHDENHALYRLVRTPFGNFVVRDEAPITQTSALKTDKTSNTNATVTQSHEEVQPEHRIVQTPFGNFVVKDEK